MYDYVCRGFGFALRFGLGLIRVRKRIGDIRSATSRVRWAIAADFASVVVRVLRIGVLSSPTVLVVISLFFWLSHHYYKIK